jgi:ATP-binding cassette subfamily B protein
MDCGPAALKAVLEGFGIRASYGRLREACQTDVDGTSIDTIEDAAVRLGLRASQVMLPLDLLLMAESASLPAIIVVRLATGGTHFVVVWRKHGRWLQVMDPAHGRRLVHGDDFLASVYVHQTTVPAEAWKEWSSGEDFQKTLRRRMERLGLNAAGDAGPAATLDAAVRLAGALVRAGAVKRGAATQGLVEQLLADPDRIPAAYWSARELAEGGSVALRGAVLIRIEGRGTAATDLPESLRIALTEPRPRPWRALAGALAEDGWTKIIPVATALTAAAAATAAEAILFRGLFDMSRHLTLSGQRLAAVGAFAAFLTALALLEWAGAGALLRLGRQLETRLRVRFQLKIPRLSDRYFQSRLISDMAQRAHAIQYLRALPELTGQVWRGVWALIFTVAGISWFYPSAWRLAAVAAVSAAAVPLLAQRALAGRDARVREYNGALTRFYLDALLGISAIRAHASERTLGAVHSTLLADWGRAGVRLLSMVMRVEAVQMLCVFVPVLALVLGEAQRAAEPAGLLLLIYWALQIPALGQEIAVAAWSYPWLRNTTLRLLEPLGSPEEEVHQAAGAFQGSGVAIELDDVTVVAGGHTILREVSVRIPAGQHVAIVGRSGAGKSSLVGLLLGWHRPARGTVRVDGAGLDGSYLASLRRQTAWVDPQVQLFNDTLYGNVLYGADEDASARLGQAVEDADLPGVIKRLPGGLQTVLGEGGALVSGGEGQRVRMARSMARSGTRLVILDEPARGLDHQRRRDFIERARRRWCDATLLCVTHDVRDTSGFERVLVIEDGRIVEDGNPGELGAQPDSHFRTLCETEDLVRRELWSSPRWRRLRMSDGVLSEESCAS